MEKKIKMRICEYADKCPIKDEQSCEHAAPHEKIRYIDCTEEPCEKIRHIDGYENINARCVEYRNTYTIDERLFVI